MLTMRAVGVNRNSKVVVRHLNNEKTLTLKLIIVADSKEWPIFTLFWIRKYWKQNKKRTFSTTIIQDRSQPEVLWLPTWTPKFQKAKINSMRVSFPVGHTLKLEKAWKWWFETLFCWHYCAPRTICIIMFPPRLTPSLFLLLILLTWIGTKECILAGLYFPLFSCL